MKNKAKKTIEIKRYSPLVSEGLSSEIVANRNKNKLINYTNIKTTKSYLRIILENTLTYFNLIWLIIFVALIVTSGFTSNLFFIVVIAANTIIAIVQEIKAKKMVEKLSLISSPKTIVVRDGKEISIETNKLVLDDIILLKNGNQIPADSIIIEGNVEVNEALLTGESDNIKKVENDLLLGGSYITSGTCYARVDKVGAENYAQKISKAAKKMQKPTSGLLKDLNKLIKIIGIFIIPIGILMFFNNKNAYDSISEVVAATSASLIGMIPSGMFLLTTLTLAVGVIRLSKKKTLVQGLYSIEMLARSNVLCLDKTGTITDGTMKVKEVYEIKQNFNYEDVLGTFYKNLKDPNATDKAMIERFKSEKDYNEIKFIPFSSKRKYSAKTFEEVGTVVIGAYEYIGLKLTDEQIKIINDYASNGLRTIVVATSKKSIIDDDTLPNDLSLSTIIAIEDHIRDDAKETIEWFKKNDVEVKIISGDNPITVSHIAKKVGLENFDKYISLENIKDEEIEEISDKYTIFGRVTPEQKYLLVKALKKKGKVVSMTGDGVNDTLALKEANCSIAMAEGSDAARNISDLVLLESKFSCMPDVVKEGRRSINNIQNSASLFLMKTLFTILLSLTCIIFKISYPYTPNMLFLTEIFVIGLTSFYLALQENKNLIKGTFLKNVLKKSLINGIILFLNVITLYFLEKYHLITNLEYETLCVLTVACVGFVIILQHVLPFNKYRLFMYLGTLIISIASVIILPSFFGIPIYSWNAIMYLAILTSVSALITYLIYLIGKLIDKNKQKKKLFNS